MKYPHETFPRYRHPYECLNIGNCLTTQSILKREFKKHFKPLTLVGLESFSESNFKSNLMKHIAQQYNFTPRKLIADVDHQITNYEFDLKDGIKLLAMPMHPGSREVSDDESWFYLSLLYLDRNQYKRKANPFKRVLEFVDWIKQMDESPVDHVFFRPYSVENQKHLDDLAMIRKFPSTKRLKRAYQRLWNAREIDILDVEGQKYWEIPLN
jgi:hypothetical protein